MIRAVAIAALVLATVAAPAPAVAAPDLAPAIAMVKAKDWDGAQTLLERQTRWGCPAPALYLLGLARAKLGDVRGALDAETRALGCNPVLEAAYRDGVVTLVRWASARLAATPFHFEGTMSSDYTPRPGAPRGDFEPGPPPPTPRSAEQIIAEGDRRVPGLAADFAAARAASPCALRSNGFPADDQKCMALVRAPIPDPPEVAIPH